MRDFYLISCIVFFSTYFSGCNIINPDEEIPAYIYLDTVILKANNTGNEKTLTHNFTDVWVFINDNNVGAYELPVTIPVPKSGKNEIKVAAGIKINGVGGFRTAYPFADFFINDSTFNLTAENITTVTPSVSYYSSTNFKWIEGFENSTTTIKTTEKSEVELEKITTNVKSGNFCGEINLTDSSDYFEAYSELAYLLPKSKPVYLELDYNIEEILYIGLKAFNNNGTHSETTLVGIQPKKNSNGDIVPVWNKIYIELTSEINAFYNTTAGAYQIAFSSIKSNDKTKARLLIDNIKVVHN